MNHRKGLYMKRSCVRITLTFVAVLSFAAATAYSASVTLPLDQQINLGHTYNTQSPSGDAIYPAFNTDTETFFAGSHVQHSMVAGGGAGGWWYQYVDLNLAGVTTPGIGLNLSGAGSSITFDARYFQDPQLNTDPYGDAPIFLRLYTYAADGDTYVGHRDYGIVYATQAPWSDPQYPAWTTVTVDVNTSAYTDGGVFDVANVSRIRFYGTDWSGGGTDFADFRNLAIEIIPEPGTLSLLLLGLGTGVLSAIRRTKRV